MMNENGNFYGQFMVDELKKLNNSQKSIETLSQWCILYRKNAKQVVETWERQFHCSQRDQRVSFLYLANDILQNSRWKGLEFVGEFWRVLPTALKDVIENGDEFGKKAALRLVDIWEERKVFGSREQVLKEELLGNRSKSGKNIAYKLKSPNVKMQEKLISSYGQVNGGPIDEDVLFGKCRTAISFIENLEKHCGTEFNIGNIGGPGVLPELQLQHQLLKECIQQLQLAESSKATLLSHLREALHEQEFKMEQLHNQLEAAQLRYDQVEQVLVGKTMVPLSDQKLNEVPPPPPISSLPEVPPPPDYPPDSPSGIIADMELSTPIHYTQQRPQGPLVHITFVASEAVIGQSMSEDYYSDSNKRRRLNSADLSSVPFYMPQQPPPPPFPHSVSLLRPLPPPLAPSFSPVTPLAPSATATQFGQTAGSLTGPLSPSSQLPPYPVVGIHPYPMVGLPPYPRVGMPPYTGPLNPYHVQGSDNGGVFAQQPMVAAPPPPMSR